jgi:hypothetical protein
MVIAVLVVGWFFIPMILGLFGISREISCNESEAIMNLKTIAEQEAAFKEKKEVDQNGNRVGEYGLLGELAGELALRPEKSKKVATPYIPEDFKTGGKKGDGCAKKSGYLYRIYLSNAMGMHPAATGSDKELGGTSAKGGPAVASDAVSLQESSFALYAWPEQLGKTGSRAFFINEAGKVYATYMKVRKYEGTNAPDAEVIYVGAPFTSPLASQATPGNDGNDWRSVR